MNSVKLATASRVLIALGMLCVWSGVSPGDGLDVVPDGPESFTFVNPDPKFSRVEKGPVHITSHITCFPTNLRAYANPLSPYATVILTVALTTDTLHYVQVQFPATTFFPMFWSWPGYYPNNGWVNFYGSNPDYANFTKVFDPNWMLIRVGTSYTVGIGSLDEAGNVSTTYYPTKFNGAQFSQYGLGMSNLWSYGNDGPISGYVQHSLSGDGRHLHIEASFPGSADPGQPAGIGYRSWCGDYYSPLMMFFDDKRPKFTGSSPFPLLTHGAWVKWPESGAPGYFLALDRDGDGKITKAEELFGATQGFTNGFESLKTLDSNHDGVIDAKDKDFRKLVLWQDRNGNGISEKDELIPISKMGVTSINLKYDGSQMSGVGELVQLRERAEFVFKDPSGKHKKGTVIDVWFGPAGAKGIGEFATQAAAPSRATASLPVK